MYDHKYLYAIGTLLINRHKDIYLLDSNSHGGDVLTFPSYVGALSLGMREMKFTQGKCMSRSSRVPSVKRALTLLIRSFQAE